MKNDVAEMRRRHNLTQEELALLCQVSRQTINAIENQRYNPSLSLALKIARVFEVGAEDIFFLPESGEG